ncbi:Hypothetical protein, putative [Bodo saltans]|uniref:Uncharacterized protein n=1 Tax=Bodo saltans TaxID=75058 RepID=A0A0S4J5U7_BODSA|nr:Hypothetical protein, putative [Bodo saltans]|eukprot:CUG63514.1 Hypothetical protein, putative [Bodo saltans]
MDVLSLARSTFPRNNMMMLYDGTTLSRLRTDVVVKLEPTSTGHYMIVTPLLDAVDYRATNEFKQKVGPESDRVDCMVISSHCLIDNLQSQMSAIQKQVDETKQKMSRARDETEELGTALAGSWKATLSSIVCSDGSDAWNALAIYPDSLGKIRDRVATATSEFNQLATEVSQDAVHHQANIDEHSTKMNEAVEKFRRSPSSEHHGGVSSSRNSAGGGSAGSASSAFIAGGGSASLQRIVRYVDTFRKQASIGIARWRIIQSKLRALCREADPQELKTIQTFTEQLPGALEELRELTIKRCAVFRAATAMSTHVEQSYLKVVDNWRAWSLKYGPIMEPLQRVAPQEVTVFKDLPMFLFPRNMCSFGTVNADVENGIEAQSTLLLSATASSLQPYLSGSDVSSPGLQSRQCTATPVHHFSSPDDTSTLAAAAAAAASLAPPPKHEATGVFSNASKDQQDLRIVALEAQLKQLQEQLDSALNSISSANEARVTVVQALEGSLSAKEAELHHSQEAAKRLAMQLVQLTAEGRSNTTAPPPPPQSAAAAHHNHHHHRGHGRNSSPAPVSSSAFVETMRFLEQEYLGIANTLGVVNAFDIGTPAGEVQFGRWAVPTNAPELLGRSMGGRHFHVRVTEPTKACNATLRFDVTLRLQSRDGDGAPYDLSAEIYDADVEHHLSEVLLNKTCTFQQRGELIASPHVLPTDVSIRPDLRGKEIMILAEVGTKCIEPPKCKLGVPMTIIQVNSVAQKLAVNATCSAN